MYHAIIIGARCAGSPTAMLLARRGFKVLLLDRATFPSDTVSTHILWPHGAEVLARVGTPATPGGHGRSAHLPADAIRCRTIRPARHNS
jgi:flavin-dependent dehydrogenase